MALGSAVGRSVVFGVVVTIVTGCTAPSRPKADPVDSSPAVPLPPPPPLASAEVEAGAEDVEPPPTGEPPPTAWTDAEHVAALVRDCGYVPKDSVRPQGVKRSDFEGSPLSCAYGLYPQVCAEDPCVFEQQDVCAVSCERTCDGCARTCQGSCKSCKVACKKGDDTCARACATSCAGCRNECVLAKDRCSSGTCTKRYDECKKAMQIKWDKSGCGAACKVFHKCIDACPQAESAAGGACSNVCEKKLGPCTAQFRMVCRYNGRMFGAISDD